MKFEVLMYTVFENAMDIFFLCNFPPLLPLGWNKRGFNTDKLDTYKIWFANHITVWYKLFVIECRMWIVMQCLVVLHFPEVYRWGWGLIKWAKMGFGGWNAYGKFFPGGEGSRLNEMLLVNLGKGHWLH